MTNILGAIAAVFLVVSAYFAWQNQSSLNAQKDKKENVEAQYNKAQKVLQNAQSDVKEASASIEEEQTKLADMKEQFNKTKAGEIEEDIAAVELRIEERKEDVKRVDGVAEESGKVERLARQYKSANLELAEVREDLSAAESKRAATDSKAMTLEKQLAKTKDSVGFYSKGQSSPDLKSKVVDVYGQYGYVTISSGDHQGVVKGSKLKVVREGATIAKLVVTAVESSSASANIVQGSLIEGYRIHPGDQVLSSLN